MKAICAGLATTVLVGLSLLGCSPPEAASSAGGAASAAGGSVGGAVEASTAAPSNDAGHEASATRRAARPPAGYAWVIFSSDTVLAEVAATPEEREKGLMFRDEVPDGTGMLFVFEDQRIRSFWMQNTYVPLDIAYIDASFVVVDIQQMAPLTTDPHDSARPAMFALEVREGWFAEHGIAVGDRARIEFGVPPRR